MNFRRRDYLYSYIGVVAFLWIFMPISQLYGYIVLAVASIFYALVIGTMTNIFIKRKK